MSEVQPNQNRRACLLVALLVSPVLLSLLAILVLAAWIIARETPIGHRYLGMPREEYSEDVREVRETVQAELEAARKQAEHDLANLPPDCPLPEGWRFESTIMSAWTNEEEDTLFDLACCTFDALYGAQEDVEEHFADLRERLGAAYKSGKATELETRFRPRGRGQTAVLDDFRDYVMQAEFLDQIETAIDHGVARYVPQVPFDYDDETLDRLWVLSWLLKLRVLYALEDGDGEAALQTCYRLHRLARPEVLPYAPYGHRERFMEFADQSLALIMGCAHVSEPWRQRLLLEYEERPQKSEIEAYLRAQAFYDAALYESLPLFDEVKQANRVFDAFGEAAQLLELPLVTRRDDIRALLRRYGVDSASDKARMGEILSVLRALPRQSVGEQLKGILMEVEDMSRMGFTRQVARTVFALEDYRIAHGWYPDTLDALIPEYLDEIPEEPAFGDLLMYTLDDTGYTLALPWRPYYFWEPPSGDEEPEEDVVWEVRLDLIPPVAP